MASLLPTVGDHFSPIIAVPELQSPIGENLVGYPRLFGLLGAQPRLAIMTAPACRLKNAMVF